MDALRKRLESVHCSTWSDPGDRCMTERETAENDKNDDVFLFIANGNDNNPEWRGNTDSPAEIVDDCDETILLQSVEVISVRKNMKNKMRKIFRCCTPCIKSEVA